jgi:hypothetical protein
MGKADRFLRNVGNWFVGRTTGVIYRGECDNYYNGYDRRYANVYEAIRADQSKAEWNWWDKV